MEQVSQGSPEAWEPDWAAIENSEIWTNEIRPWLSRLREHLMEEKTGLAPGFEEATLEKYHYWRGACHCLRTILDAPSEKIAANRQLEAQGKTDALLQQQQEQRIRNRRL